MARGGFRYRGGFTLIELLVVIAITAILASLLMPVLARAKATAQSAKCKSNLKQLTLGMLMYVQDNSGAYPDGNTGGSLAVTRENSIWWEHQIASHLSVPVSWDHRNSIFWCPARKPKRPFAFSMKQGTIFFSRDGSYGYNAHGYGNAPATLDAGPFGLGGVWANPDASGHVAWAYPTKESQVKNPSNLIAIGDGYYLVQLGEQKAFNESRILGRGGLSLPERAGAGSVRVEPREVERRHLGRPNMGFADGHVEDGKISQWYLSIDPKDVRRWRVDDEAP